jgi:hypothetical protein
LSFTASQLAEPDRVWVYRDLSDKLPPNCGLDYFSRLVHFRADITWLLLTARWPFGAMIIVSSPYKGPIQVGDVLVDHSSLTRSCLVVPASETANTAVSSVGAQKVRSQAEDTNCRGMN